MKTAFVFRLSAVLLLLLLAPLAHAQTTPAAAPNPALGYWNVETNLTTRDHSIVRFYNAHDQLVYEERLATCLDLARRGHRTRRTSRQLTAALQRVLRDPAAARSTTLLAQQFSPDRRVQRVYAVR
ncbi:hypothetical protein [Hymenobacter sp.]|uniref:hypothetical protein n=1 Tax=Hymenobacter sp. TaxID=1898978 RepID=UPI00286A937F|nr:hypothetical protein [Hymenobacter sp.]